MSRPASIILFQSLTLQSWLIWWHLWGPKWVLIIYTYPRARFKMSRYWPAGQRAHISHHVLHHMQSAPVVTFIPCGQAASFTTEYYGHHSENERGVGKKSEYFKLVIILEEVINFTQSDMTYILLAKQNFFFPSVFLVKLQLHPLNIRTAPPPPQWP